MHVELLSKSDLDAIEQERWREKLRALRDEVGGRNKLAELLGATAPHLGRILRGERPVTAKLVRKFLELGEMAVQSAPNGLMSDDGLRSAVRRGGKSSKVVRRHNSTS